MKCNVIFLFPCWQNNAHKRPYGFILKVVLCILPLIRSGCSDINLNLNVAIFFGRVQYLLIIYLVMRHDFSLPKLSQ